MSSERSRNALSALVLSAALLVAGCVTAGPVPSGPTSEPVAQVADAALMAAGESRLARGDGPGAAALFRSAHDTAPTDPEPLIKLGQALGRMGSYSDASIAYGEAVKLAPQDPDAQRGMGNALIGLAQPGLAIPYFLEAIEQAPDDWRAFLGLGVAHDLAGDPSAAWQSYEAGLALVPNQPDLVNNFALSLALDGSGDAAVDMLRRLTQSHIGERRFRGSLAIAQALAGDEAAAGALMAETVGPEAVARNLTLLRSLRGMTDHARKARVLQAIVAG